MDPVEAPSKSVVGRWIKGVFANDAIEMCKSAVFRETTWRSHFNTAIKRHDALSTQLKHAEREAQGYRIALRKITCQRVVSDPKSLVASYRALVDIANEALAAATAAQGDQSA